MLDSEKNLRVLWVRALLAAAGELQDDVAAELLPAASRWIVSAPLARTVWAPVLPKLDWVRQRTDFIDRRLDAFLAASSAPSQVILIGSGYDTRSLRYRDATCTFFEVDLPDVLSVKAKLAAKFLAPAGADGESYAAGLERRSVGCDLNKGVRPTRGSHQLVDRSSRATSRWRDTVPPLTRACPADCRVRSCRHCHVSARGEGVAGLIWCIALDG